MTNKFMRYARAAVLPIMMLGVASCDKGGDPSPIGPGKEPGTTNPVVKVGELVRVPIQFVDIDQDSVMTISNYSGVDDIVMQISLKKSDIGKGTPVKYKYTGLAPENAITQKDVMTSGGIRLTTSSETAFDLNIGGTSQDPLLRNDSYSYKNLGIEKLYTTKIMVKNETNVTKGVEKAKTFMQNGQEMNGTLLKVTGKGVPNQVLINKVAYKVN